MKIDKFQEFKQLLGDSKNVRFKELLKICKVLFGEPRNSGTSHHVFKTPWPGDPRVNLQPDGKGAKKYQVRQVMKAIEKLEDGLKNREKPRDQ